MTDGLAPRMRSPNARTCATGSSTATGTPSARATFQASVAAAWLTALACGASSTSPMVRPVSVHGAL
ncbi:Uncharacterised protein [Bordetella pertussis]|nr:Uncharacterised protein [Bordetella pertussis]